MSPIIAGALVIIAFLALVALGYWQLVIAEGAYLGPRVVAWLYDRFAGRYEPTKCYDPVFESSALAQPVLRHLRQRNVREPAILDVATGTGRFARALLREPECAGRVVAVDASHRMLAIAKQKLEPYGPRATARLGAAERLADPDDTYDIVGCLEALEFFSRPAVALREMIRVCKPGGLLVLSNRIGPDAWLLPGRAETTQAFCNRLRSLGLADVRAVSWLVDYDLVFAVKPG